MSDIEYYRNVIGGIKRKIGAVPEKKELMALAAVAQYLSEDLPEEVGILLGVTKYAKWWLGKGYAETGDMQMWNEYWRCIHLEARHLFESYMIYMEKDREPSKRFYEPRKNTLAVVAQDLQDLSDGKFTNYCLSLPARTGKSTLCEFFMSFEGGRKPHSHSAMGGYSDDLADHFYKEYLSFVTSDDYNFIEIFPESKLTEKNAERKTIQLGTHDSYPTLTCRGIEGTWTGAIDVSSDGYLYMDDLISGQEEALSPRRLAKRYDDYLNIAKDRKKDGAKEIMIGTRWNVLDPIGVLHSLHANDPKYRFRVIPALNEQTDESNFDYEFGVGFSTEYYRDMRRELQAKSPGSWEAKFQQRPYVREGLVFPQDELRYFNGVLPEGDHRIVSAVDVAWGGGDSLSMPIGWEDAQSGDIYIFDWVFSQGTKDSTIPIVVGKIRANEIQQINFEANNGGHMYRQYVDEKLQEAGYRCSCTDTKAPGNMEKVAKIMQYSDDIKRRCVFLSPEHRSTEYQKAMDELTMFVQIGKNEHDDAPDSLAQLMRFIGGITYAKITPMLRTF